ncbi:hypothetical protein [Streptomyces sp. B15]|uniref:hypothetical protein n=1 Tax=Streptomyces sp. B15 TaxID=1537797 RepID=UPI001B3799F5|nr:hypothetical protein [Streptomyces sp. B15]MBQ1122221.1 hypothetical protein [Streptomyces sp. B15]
MNEETGDGWITPPSVPPLTGTEQFSTGDFGVVDFWRFAMSDLKMNNVRGYLAEFLVHRALGSARPREEWAGHDAETSDGLRVEVKTSAYLQVWEQRHPSTIRFEGLRSKLWSPRTGQADKATYNADVYVFAVQTARSHEEYDPLDLDQWEFHVLARSILVALNQQSMALSTVRKHSGGAIGFDGLEAAIRAVSACS